MSFVLRAALVLRNTSMHSGWSSRRAWLAGAALAAAVMALNLLPAQAVDDPPVQPVTTQPGNVQTTQPAAGAARLTAAGEQLTSGLIGSKHDFTQGGRSGRDLCLPCHTPHLAAAPPPRLDQRATTTQPLRPYQGVGIELSGWSLLCLGCHDGVTARDVYSSPHAITVAEQLAGARLGARGLRSHPVGIVYPPTGDEAQTYEPRAAVEAAGLLLPDGTIQCTTCHDAHNTNRHREMLRITNQRSRLCLTCHRL